MIPLRFQINQAIGSQAIRANNATDEWLRATINQARPEIQKLRAITAIVKAIIEIASYPPIHVSAMGAKEPPATKMKASLTLEVVSLRHAISTGKTTATAESMNAKNR